MKTNLFLLAFTLICPVLFGQSSTFSYKTKNGNEIILLSEGQRQGKADILIGATPEILKATMPDGTFTMATNAFLIRTNTGKNILIDTGFGKELFNNLQQYNISADMIDAVCITHAHGDHIGGLLDKNGKKTFPNALLYLSLREYDHHYNSTEKNSKQVIAVLNAYGDKVRMSAFEELENESVFAFSAFGHTPGHTAFLIDEEVLIWGDMVHAMAVQMPYPAVAVTYDTNSAQAIKARLKLLKIIVDNNIIVAGMHIPYPGMGTLAADGKGGYIFTPLR